MRFGRFTDFALDFPRGEHSGRHAAFRLLLLFIVLAASIPLAALAGVLAVVAWNMAERHAFVGLQRSSPGIAGPHHG